MKLIQKASLVFVAGMLVASDDRVVPVTHALLDNVNDLADMAELVEFVTKNAKAIKASAKNEPVEFTPFSKKAPHFESGVVVATPLADEEKAKAEALAAEFLNVKDADKVDDNLRRYDALAEFMAEDHILVREGTDAAPYEFKINPLEITENFVLETVAAYADRDNQKLIRAIKINFS